MKYYMSAPGEDGIDRQWLRDHATNRVSRRSPANASRSTSGRPAWAAARRDLDLIRLMTSHITSSGTTSRPRRRSLKDLQRDLAALRRHVLGGR